MLSRRQRIPRRAFPTRPQHREASVSFSLAYGKGQGVAVVVSKAVAKRSVDRHLIKRRILSIVRPFVREDRYLVIYAKKPALTLSFKALSEELTGLLSRTLR